MRIYELAKQKNCLNEDIEKILDDLHVPYKSHLSSISEDTVKIVLARFDTKSEKIKPKTLDEKTPSTKEKRKENKKTPQENDKKKDDKKQEKQTAAPTPVAVSIPPSPQTLVLEAEPDTLAVPPKSALFPSPLLNELPEEIEEEIESYEEAYEEEAYEEKTAAKKKVHKTDRTNKGHQKQSESEIPITPLESSETPVFQIDTKNSIVVQNGLTIKDLADVSGIPASEIIKKLFLMGMMASINQSLDKDTILIVADEFKISIEVKDALAVDTSPVIEEPFVPVLEEEVLEARPPVVTIMGHVDHGKTTLLDAIRKTKVVDQESGGITQHIGAYLVPHGSGHICFLDTPGHAAFSSMRAMGANVTDIVILVVSATDGVQVQTLESIRHAKEAEIPIIVAINKMDATGANPDRVKSQLAENGLNPEDWGGDTLCVGVSALQEKGIQELLDAVILQAELLELKANPKGKAFAIVLESCQTDNMGPMVTVLVKNGLFRVGDALVCGHVSGKIKRMENDQGQMIPVAKPSYPVRVFGFSGVADTGARVRVFPSEKEAKESARVEADHRRHNALKKKEAITVDNLYSFIQAEKKKELKIILKTDVTGTLMALNILLSELVSEKVLLKVIHSATGTVTDSDVMLADAYSANIYAFRVKVSPSVQIAAKRGKVVIKEFDVIYRIVEEMRKAMEELLDAEYVEVALGSCEVKQIFKISKIGAIAGCLVTQGKIPKDSTCRILRKGERLPIETKISLLKHYKEEVSEVKMGTECGVSLHNFKDFEVGDVLEFYKMQQTASVL
jgi:translation initiation factor IF-2